MSVRAIRRRVGALGGMLLLVASPAAVYVLSSGPEGLRSLIGWVCWQVGLVPLLGLYAILTAVSAEEDPEWCRKWARRIGLVAMGLYLALLFGQLVLGLMGGWIL